MSLLTSHTTGYDTDAGVGDIGGTEFRRAQSFQITQASLMTSVELYLKNGATPPTDPIAIRIETDSAGIPSGTLVHANATGSILAASISGSLAYITCSFSSFSISASTTYHIVATLPSQSNNVNFVWGTDSSQGYASGTLSSSQNSGAWANITLDCLFKVNGEIPVDGGFFFLSS